MSNRRSYQIQSDRLTRIISLSALAALAALFWLGRQFEIDWDQQLLYLRTSFFWILFLAGSGAIGVVAIVCVRRLLNRRR